ncbi:Zinc finger A20 and AN1 domain-containing stress-associated protein 4 [Sesamum alatum]|uniref:Zinc finger A20 and AN1 domain-containing stress-associated protein 4 n=1 Tax=Sesamum alatum TaxID=300844 RepID=A0AAE2CSR5_9LAMI|nr:Zinc finger A20 and AN1 domain-containing stress-associated protein 4 [Sesamum alatum]
MAEEQRWQEPGGHRLCANNCGFFGSPTTLNLCSKCYKDYCIKEQQAKHAQRAVEMTLRQPTSSVLPPPASPSSLLPSKSAPPVKNVEQEQTTAEPKSTTRPNRCGACQKRVGLTGFTCRCGVTFCGSHRYPENHGCEFDYKGLGRAAIAKANPVIKAEKLNKI